MDLRKPTDPSESRFHGPAQVLANGAIGAVALCDCGQLHLNLQYITLRLEPAAFRELAAMLVSAQRRLDAVARLQAPASEAVAAPVH